MIGTIQNFWQLCTDLSCTFFKSKEIISNATRLIIYGKKPKCPVTSRHNDISDMNIS